MKMANRSSLNDEILALGAWNGLKRSLHQAFEEMQAWIGLKTVTGLI